MFRETLDGTILKIHEASKSSKISVEWVSIDNHFMNDLSLVEHFKALGLVLLPGRQFYWNRKGEFAHTGSARFALLKPKSEFLQAINVINQELRRLGA